MNHVSGKKALDLQEKYTLIREIARPCFMTGKTSIVQNIFRIVLGALMSFAGVAHLTFGRLEFRAQVPQWVPISSDIIVILSGIVEMALGVALIFWRSERAGVGIALAIFFLLIFPGNIAQYVNHTDTFGLDTDRARFVRLFFQPVLILWALWSSGALHFLKKRG
jgi:uncharacterized membrane protein